ncbi:hypothetical protein MTO96_018124 [Rhipicephalus appendiculatus]
MGTVDTQLSYGHGESVVMRTELAILLLEVTTNATKILLALPFEVRRREEGNYYRCPFLRIPHSDTELAPESTTPPTTTSKHRADVDAGDVGFALDKGGNYLQVTKRNACDIVMDGRNVIHKAPPLRTWAIFAKRRPVVSRCDPRPLCKRYRGGGVSGGSVLCCFKSGTYVHLCFTSTPGPELRNAPVASHGGIQGPASCSDARFVTGSHAEAELAQHHVRLACYYHASRVAHSMPAKSCTTFLKRHGLQGLRDWLFAC